MTQVRFVLDKKSDARNRYVSANGWNFGIDWSKNMPTEILEKIKGKVEEEAIGILDPILDEKYEILHLEKTVNDLNIRRQNNWKDVLDRMELIVWKKIPVDTITSKITTTGRCPYNADKWFFMYCPLKKWVLKNPEDSIWIAVHEILHMMLHYYYEEYIKKHGLSHEEFHDMKEAQTIILNDIYSDILVTPDSWYEIHKDIRIEFLKFRESNKDFQSFVEFGIQFMKGRRETT